MGAGGAGDEGDGETAYPTMERERHLHWLRFGYLTEAPKLGPPV